MRIRARHRSIAADVDEGEMRAALGRWLGYGAEHAWRVDDAIRVIAEKRHAAIWGPRGARIEELAAQLADESARVVSAASVGRAAKVRAAAARGTRWIVAAEATRAETFAQAASALPEVVVVRVPAMHERRGEIAALIDDARLRAVRRMGFEDSWLDPAELRGYAWPGHLDEIDRVVGFAVAMEAHGSLRRAAEALGVRKSTLADTLARVGIRRTR